MSIDISNSRIVYKCKEHAEMGAHVHYVNPDKTTVLDMISEDKEFIEVVDLNGRGSLKARHRRGRYLCVS